MLVHAQKVRGKHGRALKASFHDASGGESVKRCGGRRIHLRQLNVSGHNCVHLGIEARKKICRFCDMESDVTSVAQVYDLPVEVYHHMEIEIRRIGERSDHSGEYVVTFFSADG